jgi:hypothetical protein
MKIHTKQALIGIGIFGIVVAGVPHGSVANGPSPRESQPVFPVMTGPLTGMLPALDSKGGVVGYVKIVELDQSDSPTLYDAGGRALRPYVSPPSPTPLSAIGCQDKGAVDIVTGKVAAATSCTALSPGGGPPATTKS